MASIAASSRPMRLLGRRFVRVGDDDVEREVRAGRPLLVEQVDGLDASSESGNAVRSPWPRWRRDRRREQQHEPDAQDRRGDRVPRDDVHDPRPEAAALAARHGRRTEPAAVHAVPRIASTAGRNVREPTTETATTPMVAIAIDRKSGSSRRNRPAIEIMTARPQKKTARPAVLLAIAIPSCGHGPGATRGGRA